MSCLKEKKVLIVIDNLENVLRTDGINLRAYLFHLLESLPSLNVLSTSRDPIQDIGEITEKVYELDHLSNADTILLLEKKAGRVI